MRAPETKTRRMLEMEDATGLPIETLVLNAFEESNANRRPGQALATTMIHTAYELRISRQTLYEWCECWEPALTKEELAAWVRERSAQTGRPVLSPARALERGEA